ncbi:P-loop ATPase, Sll1717 family [Wolinella succinogenes]|uniref:P-loop ATPase, Sll1717 family n=1 Tax=Wolinella succinogenes TaxID=844 RepID=UPI002FC74BF2
MQFTEENISKLFGNEAAEDEDIERLKGYYLKGNVYTQTVNDLPLRILVGHKGIGKSALFRVAMEEEKLNNKLSLIIKPDDIIGIADNQTDFLKMIRDWKEGIREIISQKALISFGLLHDGWRAKFNEYGGQLIDFLQAFFRTSNMVNLGKSKKLVVDNFLATNKIYVYIDDLDRGWQGRKEDIKRISALLNAIRDIASENKGVYFRISLRSDVYYLVRTSDESTDKTEGSVIWFSWTNHEILALLVKRVFQFDGININSEKLFEKEQTQLARDLEKYISYTFNGRGNWEKIPTYRMMMSLIRKRPRDLVKLCTLAARDAKNQKDEIISTKNFESIFEEYSQGRLQDTINEYRFELPEIERLLFGMKPSAKQKKASENYTYTTDKLLQKIDNIRQSGEFRFANGDTADRKSLAAFMYKINFLTARKEHNLGIERKYFEESRYLSHNFVDFGYDWEVHPAYRWALQPDNINDIFKQMSPSID